MNKKDILKKWTHEDSIELYGIQYWGNDYFSISDEGEVIVKLKNAKGSQDVSIYKINKGLIERGFSLPILLRFKDILDDRLNLLYKCFQDAIKEYEYQG